MKYNREVVIAYYSAMGMYWLKRFQLTLCEEDEAKVISNLTLLVEAIRECGVIEKLETS